jgi:23S rRNA (adenine2503-C2)-methyltransferase
LVNNFTDMSNLSAGDRVTLTEQFDVAPSRVVSHQTSNDGTQKLLISWADGSQAETVMIPDADRRTACVSSQVGCPVGCRFCASGVNGVKGNLSAGPIVEQVYRLNLILAPAGERITNVVFMGMGEPLANYTNVMQAIRVLHDPKCFNMSARRITISTVGVPPKIRQLADEELPINLALSLHAPTEPLRRELIPWAEHFALDEILDACRYYFDRSGREITLEYILLAGVNDRADHARLLAKLCKTMRANVNLIRYNEVTGLPYKRPAAHDVVAFQEILRHAGVNAHVRKSRGRDIDAACGQLRRKEQEKLVQLGG